VNWRLGREIVRFQVQCKKPESLAANRTCGTSPFGIGRPRIPATNVVQPRRKKSQWKPPGFLRGNWRAWAVILLTFCFHISSLLLHCHEDEHVSYMVIVKEQHKQ
jgi:hypothetical protein